MAAIIFSVLFYHRFVVRFGDTDFQERHTIRDASGIMTDFGAFLPDPNGANLPPSYLVRRLKRQDWDLERLSKNLGKKLTRNDSTYLQARKEFYIAKGRLRRRNVAHVLSGFGL